MGCLMNVQSGCKDCKERKSNCHSSCERYAKYKEELNRINDAKRNEYLKLFAGKRASIERMQKSRCTNGICHKYIV